MSVANESTHEFFELAERFRAANDAEGINRLGEELGRLIVRSEAPQS